MFNLNKQEQQQFFQYCGHTDNYKIAILLRLFQLILSQSVEM